MSDGIPYADIVILALVAGFILLRLRSVLGQKTGFDNSDFLKPLKPAQEPREERIVQVNEKSLKPKAKDVLDPYLDTLTDAQLKEALGKIREKDAQFTATAFLEGAKLAYEMVFDAFTKADKPTLKMLLSEKLYQHFCDEIDARKNAGATRQETTLVAARAEAITQAQLSGNMAQIGVRFVSEQVTVERNEKGEIVGGNPSQSEHGQDEWVFERDVTSKNPNWKIIET